MQQTIIYLTRRTRKTGILASHVLLLTTGNDGKLQGKKSTSTAQTVKAADEVVDCGHLRHTYQLSGFDEGDL